MQNQLMKIVGLLVLFCLPLAAQEEVMVLNTVEGISGHNIGDRALPPGEPGIVNGNLLTGREQEDGGWADLLPAGGWGIVNLGWRDLASGPMGVQALVGSGGVELVTANVKSGGKLVGKPYLVLKKGSLRLAVVGVTQPPPGVKLSPRAKGFTLVDPVGVLSSLVPRVRQEADLVLVVAAMTREQAVAMLGQVSGIDLCLASGRESDDPLPLAIGATQLFTSPYGGGRWGHLEIRFAGNQLSGLTNYFTRPTGPPIAKLVAARKKHGLLTDVRRELVKEKPAPLAGEKGFLPPVGNRACKFVVQGISRRVRYGGQTPANGGEFLVLDVELENIMPLTKVRKLDLPTEYRIPNLADHIYLVAGGVRVSRLLSSAGRLPGHLPVAPFRLVRLGSRRRGNLVFPLPPGEKGPFELRFYDYAHGHMTVNLNPTMSPLAAVAPLVPTRRNKFLEVGVYGWEKGAPTAGMVRLEIDLRARSLFELDGDATAFDPKAKKGQRLAIGTVADWLESRRYLQVVVDGEYACPALAGTRLAPAPRFLPDLMTGNKVVFMVPAKRKSLELRCDFPNAKASDAAKVYRPKGLVFLLEGKRPPAVVRKPLLRIDDQVYRVDFTGQQVFSSYGGRVAPEGKKFLVLDVTVFNMGEKGEFFQTPKQVKYAAESGTTLELDPSSYLGPRRALELFWIPKGEHRSFAAAFLVPVGDQRPRVSYHGISLAKVESLPGLGRAKPIAGPQVAQEPEPAVPGKPKIPTSAPERATPTVVKTPALPGKKVPGFVPANGTYQGISVAITAMSTAEAYKGYKPHSGQQYLFVQMQWQWQAATGRKATTPWRSGRLSDRLFFYRDNRYLKRIRSGFMGQEGFHPYHVNLEKPGAIMTGNIAFGVPKGSLAGAGLVFAGLEGGALTLPLVPAPDQPAPTVVAAGENEVIKVEVLAITDLTADLPPPHTRSAWWKNPIMGLQLRITAKKHLLHIPRLHTWCQVLAGGLLPCRHYDPNLDQVKGLPLLKDYYWLPPGVPDYGLLLFSMPDKKLSLGLAAHFPVVKRRGQESIMPKPFRLSLAPGLERPKLPVRARLANKDLEVLVYRVFKKKWEKRLLTVLDVEIRLAPGSKGRLLDLTRELILVDQAGRYETTCRYPAPFSPVTKFFLPPGGARRFAASYIHREPGVRHWFRAPNIDPVTELVIPNPWVPEEGPQVVAKDKLQLVKIVKEKGVPSKKSPRYVPPPLFPEPEAKGIKGVGLAGARVNEAIRKGALYLIGRFAKEKRFVLTDRRYSLAALALLHTEELRAHPKEMAQIIDFLLRRKLDSVYDAALTIMGLVCIDPVRYRPRIRQIAQLLVDRQSKGGGWGYISNFTRALKPDPSLFSGKGDKIIVLGGEAIRGWPGTKREAPVILQPVKPLGNHGSDNSCSQYALLGLQAASHAGVMAPRETWVRAEKYYIDGHNRGFGWGYGQRGYSTGSMTTAGLSALAITRFNLQETGPGIDLSLRSGVDWLGRNFRLDNNPVGLAHHYYYLYGLERAGRLTGKEFFGVHEWYPEGAKFLVDNQDNGGSWKSSHNGHALKDTAYALLFLTKATEELGKEKVDTGPGWLAVNAPGMGGTVAFILDASGSMMAPIGEDDEGPTRFSLARKVVLQVLAGSGEGLNVALRAYGHRYRSIDKRAAEDSELLVGFGPPNRPALAAALAKLRCRGKTPLTFSIHRAREELARAEGERKRIVLLTDGNESDRKAKPVKAAAAVKAAGMQLDVVSFAMDDPYRLEQMAEAGGGTCYSANDGDALLKAVKCALLGVVPFRILAASGKEVAKGKSGDKCKLPAGPYTVEINLPGGVEKVDAWVHQGATTSITVRTGND